MYMKLLELLSQEVSYIWNKNPKFTSGSIKRHSQPEYDVQNCSICGILARTACVKGILVINGDEMSCVQQHYPNRSGLTVVVMVFAGRCGFASSSLNCKCRIIRNTLGGRFI